MSLHRDDGVTLTELAVALFVVSIIMAGAVTWAISTARQDDRNRDATSTLDELRFAKTEMIKDIRFADELTPPVSGDDAITFWLDDGDEVKETGESITYEIQADRTLTRTTDDPADPVKVVARGVVAAESAIVISGNTVDITISVDLDPTDSYQSRQIQTSISARNA